MERIPLEISQVDDPAQIFVDVDDFGQALEFGVLLQRIRHIGHKGEAKTFRPSALAGRGGGTADHDQEQWGDWKTMQRETNRPPNPLPAPIHYMRRVERSHLIGSMRIGGGYSFAPTDVIIESK